MQDTQNGREWPKNHISGETSGNVTEKNPGVARGRRIARKIAVGAVYVAVGWLLGSCKLFFGTYPLGLAAVCAASDSVALITAGAVASAFAVSGRGGLLTGAYIIALALRDRKSVV